MLQFLNATKLKKKMYENKDISMVTLDIQTWNKIKLRVSKCTNSLVVRALAVIRRS